VDPWQIDAFGPAEAVAAFEIVNVIKLTAFPQGELPIADNVNVTLPAAISAALGVYTGCNIAVLLKVPVPDVVHARVE